MITDLSFKKEAREKMKRGVDILADAVKVTLGAKGRNVCIRDERTGQPKLTKDGVSVARVINLNDKYEDMGAQLVKNAAERTAVTAGDGTTTSTILAQELISGGMGLVNDKSVNPIEIAKGIDIAVYIVKESLRNQAQQIDIHSEKLLQIATISANNDAEIGKVVTDAIRKTGRDGYITISTEGAHEDTWVEFSEGLKFDLGYLSEHFVTNKSRMMVEFTNALILMCERKVSSIRDIQRILEYAIGKNSPLLIIADDVEGEVLHTLVANCVQRKYPFAAIKIPGMGNMRTQILDDIAVMTGGTVVSESQGHVLSQVPFEVLGSAKQIAISKNLTTIIGGKGKKKDISERLESVRALMENTPNEYEKEKIKTQRLARISNSIAVIHVGGFNDVEKKEKKDRIDDAVCATKAAIEEGILPGGGVAYLKSINWLRNVQTANSEQGSGVNLVSHAIRSPFIQILNNAGRDGADEVKTILQSDSMEVGFNVITNTFENMIEAGVIDPAKVSRVALENAASVAKIFLTTECAIIDSNK